MRGKIARILRKQSAFDPNEPRLYCREEMDVKGIKIPMRTMYECTTEKDGTTSFNTTRRIYKILKTKYKKGL